MRLLLRYEMEDDGSRVISLLRGCPRGAEAQGLLSRNIGFSLCIVSRRSLCASEAISVVFLCVSWQDVLLLLAAAGCCPLVQLPFASC